MAREKATSTLPDPSDESERLELGARVANASLQTPGLTVLAR